MSASVISLMAVIATPYVTDPNALPYRAWWGGEVAIQATQACIDDGRDMAKGFVLRKVLTAGQGVFTVQCEILQTETGPYYASKGEYLPMPMLKEIVRLFEQKGYSINYNLE